MLLTKFCRHSPHQPNNPPARPSARTHAPRRLTRHLPTALLLARHAVLSTAALAAAALQPQDEHDEISDEQAMEAFEQVLVCSP